MAAARVECSPAAQLARANNDELNSHSCAAAATAGHSAQEPRARNGPQSTAAAANPAIARRPPRHNTSGAASPPVAFTPKATAAAKPAEAGRPFRIATSVATTARTPSESGCAENAVS
ncbi:MAG: hypothetical protein FJW31_20435 [Acidobacteria bacterium]|nr:hypothetical protein [Acidobacteriota bacterium]